MNRLDKTRLPGKAPIVVTHAEEHIRLPAGEAPLACVFFEVFIAFSINKQC